MINPIKPLGQLGCQGLSLVKSAVGTWHGRFVLAGLCFGLIYLPVWLSHLFKYSFVSGSKALSLILVTVALSGWLLWAKRKQIAQLPVLEVDQTTGHLLIVCGLALLPFCRFAVWPQAILWLIVLVGIALSTWGMQFFTRHPLIVFLFAVTAYPKPGALVRLLWEALTPYQFLERIMAQAGAIGLRLIGQSAVSEGPFLAILPNGAVEVDWGCNGFSMAVTMAVSGLFMGIFLKQNWLSTTVMVVVGAILALIFNIPRIMLLAMASVYWGEASFKFWHGTWGGQLFTGILFTVYYYSIMGIVNRRKVKHS